VFRNSALKVLTEPSTNTTTRRLIKLGNTHQVGTDGTIVVSSSSSNSKYTRIPQRSSPPVTALKRLQIVRAAELRGTCMLQNAARSAASRISGTRDMCLTRHFTIEAQTQAPLRCATVNRITTREVTKFRQGTRYSYEVRHADYKKQYQQPRYKDRRPQHQRRRSSWSPQRPGRDRGQDRRARSGSRSRSRSRDKQDRILATVAGGLIGGLLANQARKGKKYDTAATVVGAVVGGLGAREATELWEKKKARREDCDDRWDERYGDSRDRRRDDRDGRRRDDRDGRYEDRSDTHDDHRRRYDDGY
jgi:hypothetical protein